jgi:hypothetical protein
VKGRFADVLVRHLSERMLRPPPRLKPSDPVTHADGAEAAFAVAAFAGAFTVLFAGFSTGLIAFRAMAHRAFCAAALRARASGSSFRRRPCFFGSLAGAGAAGAVSAKIARSYTFTVPFSDSSVRRSVLRPLICFATR